MYSATQSLAMFWRIILRVVLVVLPQVGFHVVVFMHIVHTPLHSTDHRQPVDTWIRYVGHGRRSVNLYLRSITGYESISAKSQHLEDVRNKHDDS